MLFAKIKKILKNKNIHRKRHMAIMMMGLILVTFIPSMNVHAAEVETYTIAVTGSYRNPQTQEIEDSGGEDSYALGESMVQSVVDSTGLLEQSGDGVWNISFRLHMMDNISSVTLYTQENGSSTWTEAIATTTGDTGESKDFRIALPGENAIMKAECFVDAMGRSVIFYLSYGNQVEGNTTDFAVLSNSDSVSGSASLAGEEGLTVGTMNTDVSSVSTSLDGNAETTDNDSTSGMVLDDSIWLVLFGVFFGAVFFAGLLLILFVLLIKNTRRNKKEIRQIANERLFQRNIDNTEEDDMPLQFLDDGDEEEL